MDSIEKDNKKIKETQKGNEIPNPDIQNLNISKETEKKNEVNNQKTEDEKKPKEKKEIKKSNKISDKISQLYLNKNKSKDITESKNQKPIFKRTITDSTFFISIEQNIKKTKKLNENQKSEKEKKEKNKKNMQEIRRVKDLENKKKEEEEREKLLKERIKKF